MSSSNVTCFKLTQIKEFHVKKAGPLASELVWGVTVVDFCTRVLGHDLLHLLSQKFKLLYRYCGFDPCLPHLQNNFFKQFFAVGSLKMRKDTVRRKYILSGKKQAAENTQSIICFLKKP